MSMNINRKLLLLAVLSVAGLAALSGMAMYEMQRVQPKIKELQKKYKDDKQKLQEEMMKFYKENEINPFGGCLPLLLQFVLLIPMYSVIRDGLTNYDPPAMVTVFVSSRTVPPFAISA
mgnify:CR=1 FL=1